MIIFYILKIIKKLVKIVYNILKIMLNVVADLKGYWFIFKNKRIKIIIYDRWVIQFLIIN